MDAVVVGGAMNLRDFSNLATSIPLQPIRRVRPVSLPLRQRRFRLRVAGLLEAKRLAAEVRS